MKPPPPTVRPVQHAGPLLGPERQAPYHIPVCQGSIAEEAVARRGGDEGSLDRAFDAYGEPLENVTTFRYLGRVLTAGDNDWLEVVGNLGKAQKNWGRLSRILSREGVDLNVSGIFHKAVAQAVLLFRAETWFLTPRM